MEAENDLHETVEYAKEMAKIEQAAKLLIKHQPLWHFTIK
jgi:hypothetical protein